MNYYIHVPFCASKCGYCVFYSVTDASAELRERYLEKLFSRLEAQTEKAETVYIGGGTPTLFDAETLARFLDKVLTSLPCGEETEISIEANPETLTQEKIAVLKKYVTRLSTGVQSFFPEVRELLGRKCGQKQLEAALAGIAEAGFPHWNCDLIYAVPGRKKEDWAREFDFLSRYPVDHVSCYSLTPEEGARLYGRLAPCGDALAAELEEVTRTKLAERGIGQYEVSNYARPGSECRHNVNVWRGGLLRGFGPSASSFDGTDRTTEAASLTEWLAGAPPVTDRISRQARLDEIFAVNLRTVAGWSEELWEKVPHADLWQVRLEKAEAAAKRFPGCFVIAPQRIKLARKGLDFWDTIAEELLS